MSRDEIMDALPYGMWVCADGREVLFNRRYKPILERMPGQTAVKADRGEWVKFVQQCWFYDDRTDLRRDRATVVLCKAVLSAFSTGATIALDTPETKPLSKRQDGVS